MITSDSRTEQDYSKGPTNFEAAVPSYASLALTDVFEGTGKTWFWFGLAVRDIKARYQGSMLGPFWVTLSTAVLITVIGFIYARILKTDATQFIPYIAIGLVFWQFIAGVLTSAGSTFIAAAGILQQARIPLSVHVLREVSRQTIAFAHMIVLIPIVFLIFGRAITWDALWAIPGFFFVILNVIWVSTVLGIVSARFRDIPQIISSTIQVLFFCTPIFWYPETMGDFGGLMVLNPIYAIIDIVRSPMLGETIRPSSWPIVFLVTTIGMAGAFALFARFRSRIVFWV